MVHTSLGFTQVYGSHRLRVYTGWWFTRVEGSHRLRVHTGWGFTRVEGSHGLRIHTGWGFTRVEGSHGLRVHTVWGFLQDIDFLAVLCIFSERLPATWVVHWHDWHSHLRLVGRLTDARKLFMWHRLSQGSSPVPGHDAFLSQLFASFHSSLIQEVL